MINNIKNNTISGALSKQKLDALSLFDDLVEAISNDNNNNDRSENKNDNVSKWKCKWWWCQWWWWWLLHNKAIKQLFQNDWRNKIN